MRRSALPALALAALVLLAGCNVGPGGDENETIPTVTPADVPTDTPADRSTWTPVPEDLIRVENADSRPYTVEVLAVVGSEASVVIRYANGTAVDRRVPANGTARVAGNVSAVVASDGRVDGTVLDLDPGDGHRLRLRPSLDRLALLYVVYHGDLLDASAVRYGLVRCPDEAGMSGATIVIHDENVTARPTCEPASD